MEGKAARPRPLVAGNWKMNGTRSALAQAKAVADALGANPSPPPVDVVICPPATLVMVMSEILKGSPLAVGAQDCHTEVSGAHTGDMSAEILADAGASAIIVGHSERRANHGETDCDVNAKQRAVIRAGCLSIVCVGETAGQRRAGQTLNVVLRQLDRSLDMKSTSLNTVIAYEPVWAIGTGLTPTLEDVAQIHKAIRDRLVSRFGEDGTLIRILYGGSVKAENARELMQTANVDGALVGGASLKAADFLGIIGSYR